MINGKWSKPKTVYSDNWSIYGCPVNGPAISTLENNAVVVWFTGANDTSTVKISFSDNNGDSFNEPIIIAQNSPSGRVDVEFIDADSALVSWLDTVNEIAVIQIQRIYKTGEKSAILNVSKSSESRSSGFPRMVINNNHAFLTWTNSGDTLTVKTAKINIKTIPAQ